MNDYSEKFLDAEAQVTELASQLVELKEETKHYSEAADSMSESQANLADLIESVDNVVSQFGSIIKALKKIGTEEIVSAVVNCQKIIDDKLGVIREEQNKLKAEGIKEIASSIDYIWKGIDDHLAVINENQTRISEDQQQTKNLLYWAVGLLVFVCAGMIFVVLQ